MTFEEWYRHGNRQGFPFNYPFSTESRHHETWKAARKSLIAEVRAMGFSKMDQAMLLNAWVQGTEKTIFTFVRDHITDRLEKE